MSYIEQEPGGVKMTISREAYLQTVESVFAQEREKIDSSSLARGFVNSGQCGTSEADWFMLSEYFLGFEDDYEFYVTNCPFPDFDDPTNAARYSITKYILTQEQTDLSGRFDISECAVNEMIWLGAAQKVNGFDCENYIDELVTLSHADGSFGLSSTPDPDLTAMSLILLPVGSDEALKAQKALQRMWQSGEINNCEAAAWSIIGLYSQDIEPSGGEFFYPDSADSGMRAIDLMMSCCNGEGFSHLPGAGSAEAMPTYQSLTALAAMAEYHSGGGGLFDGRAAEKDIYNLDDPCGESFDAYDIKKLESAEASAVNAKLFEWLKNRAELYGADLRYSDMAAEKLKASRTRLREIESINSQIRNNFYPPSKANIFKVVPLHKLNERISEIGGEDRTLVLAADELSARERELWITSAVWIVIVSCSIVFIVGKRKRNDRKNK